MPRRRRTAWTSPSSVDLETIIALIAVALAGNPVETRDRVSAVYPLINFDYEDVWKDMLRDWWRDHPDAEERARAVNRLGLTPESAGEAGELATTRLEHLLGRSDLNIRLLELTPQQWSDIARDILDEATEQSRLLCLFDQDLSKASVNGVRQNENAGIDLLQEVLDETGAAERVYCGLLSGKFGTAEEETQWRSLAREHGLPLQQVLPISKDRLGDAMEFAHGVKLAAVNLNNELLKDMVQRVSHHANHTAMESLRELSVRDFHHIVLTTSRAEGVWEAETLFRVFNLYERRARSSAVLGASERGFFDRLTDLVVRITAVQTGAEPVPSGKVRFLRRLELYQADEDINPFHLPLELGDLFSRQGKEGGTFILLAQPCDLMIRGARGTRTLGAGVLVPIRSAGQPRDKHREIYPACPYFQETADGQDWYFDFPNAVEVSLDVLDLAVFSESGDCDLNVGEKAPDRLFVPWKQRYIAVANRFKQLEVPVRHVFAVFDADETGGVAGGTAISNGGAGKPNKESRKREAQRGIVVDQLLAGFALKPGFLRPTYEPATDGGVGGRFSFHLRRVGRLLAPAAQEVLARYQAYRARAASDHDFAEELATERDQTAASSAAVSPMVAIGSAATEALPE